MKRFRSLIILVILFLPARLISQNIDIRLLRAIYSPEALVSDNFFRFVSKSDSYFIIGTPAVLAVTGFIRHDDKMFRNALVNAGASVINLGITTALKYTVNRNRPFETYPDIIKKADAGSPSFPSGHTSGAFATATALSLSYPEWYVIAPSFAYAGTVAYSRMYLGVHYPSDVLAGALVGAGSAYLTFKVNQILRKKRGI